jgi:uncharacterized protein YndB with AHSA1/START domain
MQTTPTETIALEITRFINARPERVYAAWTDPAQLRQWFGPREVQTTALTADPRPGGIFQWDLVNCEGESMTMRGQFRELQPNKKVVFTWQWLDDGSWEDQISVVTVELSARDDGTELRLRHEQFPSEQSRDNHTKGWSSVLDKLEDFCG